MVDELGRPPSGRATAAAQSNPQAVSSEAGIPDAGQWALFRAQGYTRSSGYVFGAAKVIRVSPKLVYAEALYRRQFPLTDVFPMPDEATARSFEQRLKAVIAIRDERIKDARAECSAVVDGILAQAMSGFAQDPQGLGPKDASAVRQDPPKGDQP